MPPSRNNAQRRALALSRSLANAILPKFVCSFFSISQPTRPIHHPVYPVYQFHPPPPPPPPPPRDIGRPRNLRRAPNYYVAQLHFVHRLPFEILSLIFVLGSQADTNLPTTVSHVCRTWRQIALHTPSLWRIISLTPHERLWRERMHRARACTLDVELLPWRMTKWGGRRSQDLNAYNVQWYMHLVLPYIHRWRSLEILFSDHSPYLWRAALAGCGSPAPALEELTLVYRSNDNTQEFLLFSEQAPRLRRLTVDGIRLLWSPRLFANLTYLDYTHHGFTSGHQAVHDVISILSISRRLVDLRIMFPRGQVARLPSRREHVTRRIKLPNLSSLQLTVDGSDIPFELAQIVTLLSAPALVSLRLVDLTRSSHSFPSLKSFFYVYSLPRSLRIIHVGYGWYDPRMVQPMAQNLPQLAQIVINRSRAPEQVLEVNTRVKRTGERGRMHDQQASYRHYRIDHLNVQYYPGVKAY